MATTHKVQCDHCGADLTDTGNCVGYRLDLTVTTLPHRGGLVTMAGVYPPLERDANFCGVECLRRWLAKEHPEPPPKPPREPREQTITPGPVAEAIAIKPTDTVETPSLLDEQLTPSYIVRLLSYEPGTRPYPEELERAAREMAKRFPRE